MNTNLLLLGAGFLAGTMNALAGGGSFVSLPALIAAGVPSVLANASSTVALYPGGVASAWVYRHELRGVAGLPLRPLLISTLAGGFVGALLLLSTDVVIFDRLLPWLLLLATLTLTFSPALRPALHARFRVKGRAVLAVQFVLGIYGGYFGGAVGLMMMSAWSLLEEADIKALNAPRTLLVSAANGIALLCFIAAGAVRWRETLLIGGAALAGGYLGAQLGRRLPSGVVRITTIALAVLITLAFFIRGYGWKL